MWRMHAAWVATVAGVLALGCGDSTGATADDDSSGGDGSTTATGTASTSTTTGVDTGTTTGESTSGESTSEGTTTGTADASTGETGSSTGVDCTDPDQDDDGHDAIACGGDDCDDDDETIHPGILDGPWDAEIVDAASTVNATDLAVDGNDVLYIAYTRQNSPSELRLASNAGGNWTVDTVDSAGGEDFTGAAIALDADDGVHIAYVGPAGLSYATNESGAWQTETVDCALQADLAIDGAGDVHFVYACAAGLRHAWGSFGSWQAEDVVALASRPSVFADADELHVSYWADGTDLGHAHLVAGLWSTEVAADMGTIGIASSIAVDSLGFAHVSSWNATEARTEHATDATGAWASDVVGPAVAAVATAASDLAIDANDRVVVAWYGTAAMQGALLVATPQGGAWIVQEPAGEGHDGLHTSLALDSGGAPHVAYYQLTAGELRVIHALPDGVDANCDGAPW